MRQWFRGVLLASCFVAGVAVGNGAHAGPNLVSNGDFEVTVDPSSGTSLTASAQVTMTNVANWSVNGGYSFVFLPAPGTTSGSSADNAGGTGQYGNLKLWGPGDGSTNGLTQSPTGGNFIASDGAFQPASLTQTIGGLTAGTVYQLSFWWAAGQQSGFTGQTTENWAVTFGNQSYTTPTVTTPNMGFAPWTKVTTYLEASATSQALSFLAAGTPNGTPPFSLLDGVALVAAPEPATWAITAAGIAGFGLLARRRRRTVSIAGGLQ